MVQKPRIFKSALYLSGGSEVPVWVLQMPMKMLCFVGFHEAVCAFNISIYAYAWAI